MGFSTNLAAAVFPCSALNNDTDIDTDVKGRSTYPKKNGVFARNVMQVKNITLFVSSILISKSLLLVAYSSQTRLQFQISIQNCVIFDNQCVCY
ncbi:hypothetical protein L1987_58479 [Smallanthus sonchifolius]|uniref:Uncharacterized protein n=1 Tax=Smallanthus sonchifolius TaxID=185202 RepID=A0ACB9DG82_9ASTR|nr:hypothetical protein L1987_58479 [Smallanthus sonchifolius]